MCHVPPTPHPHTLSQAESSFRSLLQAVSALLEALGPFSSVSVCYYLILLPLLLLLQLLLLLNYYCGKERAAQHEIAAVRLSSRHEDSMASTLLSTRSTVNNATRRVDGNSAV